MKELKELMRGDPEIALIHAIAFCRNSKELIVPVASLFLEANHTQQLTHFVLQFMPDKCPENAAFHTLVLLRNLEQYPLLGKALL
jgi:hypothetical protein